MSWRISRLLSHACEISNERCSAPVDRDGSRSKQTETKKSAAKARSAADRHARVRSAVVFPVAALDVLRAVGLNDAPLGDPVHRRAFFHDAALDPHSAVAVPVALHPGLNGWRGVVYYRR